MLTRSHPEPSLLHIVGQSSLTRHYQEVKTGIIFFHVLKAIGDEIPEPQEDEPLSSEFSEKIYNEIFNRTNRLIVKRVVVSRFLYLFVHILDFISSTPFQGTLVDTLNSPDRKDFRVVILGPPTQTPAEEQQKLSRI